MANNNGNKLSRSLSMLTLISIAAGAVIGGWLAEAPYWFSLTGAGAAFIFPALAILLVPVGLAFAEMAAMLPFSSSVAVWTANATNHRFGWCVQWLMFLIQIVEPPICAFILTTALGFFFTFTVAQTTLIAVGICVIWYVVSNFNISISGKLSNIFFYSMIGISIVIIILFFTSGSWSVDNLVGHGGMFPKGGYGIFLASGVLTIKYIGFEMTPTVIEECSFPAKKLWKVILAALFIPAVLYGVVVIAIGGMAPWSELAEMSMPEPELIKSLGLPMIFAWAALLAGSLHGFTTFMGFWTSSARVLYGSSQLNMLPKAFLKLNKHGQPYWANLTVLLFSVFFCIFSASNWVQYIYAVSCIAAGLVYFFVCFDTYRLRKTHPEWKRPYKAPFGNWFLFLGMIVSIWVVVASSLSLDFPGWMSLVAYLVIGVVVLVVMEAYRKKHPGKLDAIVLTPDDVKEDEAGVKA
ncbi:MAG: GABA permease [Firmicutes bacterium ADurb.Bin182]|nr:MAG: GABA permease [Firmicutes bacterium ADurb.Bin182]